MCVMCDIYIYKCKRRLLLLGLKKWHALYICLESIHGLNLGCRKGRAHWTRIFILSQTEHILGHQWSKKFAFHGINQGKCFIYCHLMHALISTCDPMSFKISSLFTCWSIRIPSKSLSMLSSIVSRKEDKCTWKVNSVNHSRILQLKRKNSNRISQAPFCYT